MTTKAGAPTGKSSKAAKVEQSRKRAYSFLTKGANEIGLPFTWPIAMDSEPHSIRTRRGQPDRSGRQWLVTSGGRQCAAMGQPGIGGAAAKRLEQRHVSAVILMVCAFEPLPSRCIWPQSSMASKSHQLNLASSDTATDQIGPLQLRIVAAGGSSCSGPKSSGGRALLPSGSGSWR